MKSVVFLFALAFVLGESFNILVVNDLPARSGFQFLKPILKQLSLSGHNLTVISNFAFDETLPNYKEVLLNSTSILVNTKPVSDLQYIQSVEYLYKYLTPQFLSEYSIKLCDILFSTKTVQELYQNKANKFDVILLNIFHSECVFQMAKIFGSPIIGYHATVMVPWAAGKFALPMNPAVVPNNFLPLCDKMSFIERVENTIVMWGHLLYNRYVMVSNDKKVLGKYFGEEAAADLDKIGYNSSLFFSNTHYTVNLPRVTLPNIIEIGGIHIGKAKVVPKVCFLICLMDYSTNADVII